MKKMLNWEYAFHLLGFIGSLLGVIGLRQKGFSVYCWPLYCAIWIVVSHMKSMTIKKLEENL